MPTATLPSLPVAVLLLDSALRIRSANEKGERFLRSARRDRPDCASGQTLADCFPTAAVELHSWRSSDLAELALDTATPEGGAVRIHLQREHAANGDEITAVLYSLEPLSGELLHGAGLPALRQRGAVSPYAEALLRTQGILVIVFDADFRLLRCNPAFEQLTGYPEQALRDHKWFELVFPRERYPQIWEDRKQYAGEVPPLEYVTPLLTASGEERCILWCNNVAQQGSAVVETVSVGLDMTEFVRAQEQLRRSEQQNRVLLASLPQRIFFKDEAGRFLLVNDPFAADFGMTPVEFVGKTDADLFPAELAAKYRADDQMVMQTRQSYQLVETNKTAGVTRFVEVTKAPVVGDDGETLGVLGIFTDVTERKRIEEALAQERDLLHTLMDSIPDLIYFKDAQSRFIRANHALAAHLGVSDPSELVGKCDTDIYPIEETAGFLDDEQKLMRSGEPLIGKLEQVTPPNQPSRWFSTTKVPLYNTEGQSIGLVGVGRDITERMQAEAELQKAASDLARSNEELEQFAYVASHDLQEPLRMVASYTQLLERRYADKLDDDAREFIHYAVDGAIRMQGLIQDLLAYSRVGTRGTSFEWVDCNRVVQRVKDHLQLAISDHRALVEVDPLPTVFGDPSQLMQLFQNLLGNAIKFHGEQPPHVQISAEHHGDDGGEWLFRVRDNGIGIDPEYAEKIFVIFQRLHGKSKYPGSGIGLSICKKIVLRHGGKIWVESREGTGATFCFTMPVSIGQSTLDRPSPGVPAERN